MVAYSVFPWVELSVEKWGENSADSMVVMLAVPRVASMVVKTAVDWVVSKVSRKAVCWVLKLAVPRVALMGERWGEK